jgi:hypothetical protein
VWPYELLQAQANLSSSLPDYITNTVWLVLSTWARFNKVNREGDA